MQNVSAVGQTATRTASPTAAARSGATFNAGWEVLTADDWKTFSAMAGRPMGPNSPGMKPGDTPALPIIGIDMIAVRQSGAVGPGESFSADYFIAQLQVPDQPAAIREQLERALAYTTQRDQANARGHAANTYLDTTAGRVNLYG